MKSIQACDVTCKPRLPGSCQDLIDDGPGLTKLTSKMSTCRFIVRYRVSLPGVGYVNLCVPGAQAPGGSLYM